MRKEDLCDNCGYLHWEGKCRWEEEEIVSKVDPVNPPHYKCNPSGVEAIEVTQHMSFCIGNAMKYLWRCGLKRTEHPVTDLRKAIWYLEKEIGRLERDDN